MKRNILLTKVAIVTLLSFFTFTGVVAQSATNKSKSATDTIPNKKAKDIDDATIKIEISKGEIEKAMKEIDWQKVQQEIKESMAELKVNMAEVRLQIAEAMKQIDGAKIQVTIDNALKEIDTEKMKKELQEAVAKIDTDKINKDLEKFRTEELPKIREEISKMKPEIEKSLEKAKVELEKAKLELSAYKSFISGLEKDGLLKSGENYTIEYKSGELFVNGNKVNSEIQQKYNDFLKGKKDFKIKKDGDGFSMNN